MKSVSQMVSIFLGAFVLSVSPTWSTDLKSDLDLLSSWFEGEFDNFEQVAEEKSQQAEKPHHHIHSVFAPVEVPNLGERVFYVQQSSDGDLTNIYRQRLYSFEADTIEDVVVMRIYRLADEESAVNAHLDQNVAASIRGQELIEIVGCEVLWQREVDAFKGKARAEGCKIISDGKEMIFRDEVTLRRDSISIKEWAVDSAGNTIWGGPETEPSIQNRCTFYEGWVVFKPEGSDEEYQVMRNLQLHDQGDRITIGSTADGAAEFAFELATLTYEKSKLPVLKLSLFENTDEGDSKVVYTWNEIGAERIGFNLGWAQAGFSKVPGPSSPELQMLRDWMTGSFSSEMQAGVDPDNFYDIRLQMTPIWTNRTDAYWLYVEQAVADHLDKPYRQRVYRVSQVDQNLFESRVYSFDEPLNYAGAWQDEQPLKDLRPDDLSLREGCSILLRWTGSSFEGSTLGRLCESSLRGATFATSEVVVSPGQVVSWDRGFDSSGLHVWGAEKSGYQFLKN